MIKGFIHQEDIILNVYATNNRAARHRKQKLTALNGKKDKSSYARGVQPSSLSNWQKAQVEDLNDVIEPSTEHTFFLQVDIKH